MPDLFGVAGGGTPPRNGPVKDWVRSAFALGEGSTVMVAELACSEPGCPPVETVIAILDAGTTCRFTVHRPIAEVSEADIRALAHTPTPDAHQRSPR